jgi:hypothetical protein
MSCDCASGTNEDKGYCYSHERQNPCFLCYEWSKARDTITHRQSMFKGDMSVPNKKLPTIRMSSDIYDL